MKSKEIFCLVLIGIITLFNPLIINAQTSCNGLCDPLGLEKEKRPIAVLAGRIINAILGIVGSLALIMFIYGGLVWMTAGGNEQRVKKGRDILSWAVLGLVVIFASYAILKLIFQALEPK
jgi:hypothetical protein